MKFFDVIATSIFFLGVSSQDDVNDVGDDAIRSRNPDEPPSSGKYLAPFGVEWAWNTGYETSIDVIPEINNGSANINDFEPFLALTWFFYRRTDDRAQAITGFIARHDYCSLKPDKYFDWSLDDERTLEIDPPKCRWIVPLFKRNAPPLTDVGLFRATEVQLHPPPGWKYITGNIWHDNALDRFIKPDSLQLLYLVYR